jgi:GPH family glycoside/pentoside/hexuronide:cation symporter
MKEKMLSIREKICYGIGDTSLAFTYVMISVLLAVYLTDVIGMRPSYVAIVVFVGKSWDYIVDPFLGYIVNKTKSRWGTYRPWLMFASIPMGIMFFLLWIPTPIKTEAGLCLYYCIIYFLFVAFSSMLEVSYGALTPRLTSDYDERTSLTTIRMIFSIVGQTIAFILPFYLLNLIDSADTSQLTESCFFVAILSVGLMLTTAFGTKERVQLIEEKQDDKITVVESLKAAFKNPPFLFAVSMYTLTITGFEISNFMLAYFLNYGVQVSGDVTFVMIAYFGVSLCTLPLWNWLAQKYSKTFSYAIALAGLMAIRLIMLFVPTGVSSIGIWLFMGASGFFFSGAQALPWAIVPDSLEYDEYKTGHRHEGVFYALMAAIRGAVVSVTLPCVLLLMEAFGFQSGGGAQPESASMAIRLIYVLAPVVLFGITIILTRKYPLTRERFEMIRTELKERKNRIA